MLPSGYVASSNDLLPGLRGLFTYHFQLRNRYLQRLLTVLAQYRRRAENVYATFRDRSLQCVWYRQVYGM